jgi:hypothetical protein
MLEGMDLSELSWGWSFAVVALCWLALMAGVSLVVSKGNVAQCLRVWRFVLFEGFEWLVETFRGPRQQPDPRATARQLSDVLQIPMIDAELSLELSRAFFEPSGDPHLNSEAMELLRAPIPRNQAWRARASECLQRLSALDGRCEATR